LQFAKAEAAEKFRIEGRSEAQCCSPVAGIGRALVKQTCRGDVTGAQKSVAMVLADPEIVAPPVLTSSAKPAPKKTATMPAAISPMEPR
jgi:hypothetical protein